jgi:hypothetical protein
MLAALPWLYAFAVLSILGGSGCVALGLLHPSQRSRYGAPLKAASLILGISLWLRSIILVYYVWGTAFVVFGIALGGIGIIPVAIVAFYKTGYHSNALFLAVWLGIAIGGYIFARNLARR